MTPAHSLFAVFALLNYCSAEIQNNNAPEWYSANVILGDFSPKPLTEIFTTDKSFSTKNPIIVTESTPFSSANQQAQTTFLANSPTTPPELPPTFAAQQSSFGSQDPTNPTLQTTFSQASFTTPPPTLPPTFATQPNINTTQFFTNPTPSTPAAATSIQTPTAPQGNFPSFVAIPGPTGSPNVPPNYFYLFPQMPGAMPNIQQNQLNLSQNQPNLPQNLQNFPQNQQIFSQNQPNFPQNQLNLPQNQLNVPQNQPNIPQNQPNLPQNQPNLFLNQPNLPQNQPNTENMQLAQQINQQTNLPTTDPVVITPVPCNNPTGNPQPISSSPLPTQNNTRSVRIRMISPAGTVTNINVLNGPGGLQVQPSTMRTTTRRNRRRNSYDGCVNACGDRRDPICAAPAGVRPVNVDDLRGFPTVCHMACHNSFRREPYERLADGRCGRLRTRIVPIDTDGRLRRPDMNRAQYTISDDQGNVIQVNPLRQKK